MPPRIPARSVVGLSRVNDEHAGGGDEAELLNFRLRLSVCQWRG